MDPIGETPQPPTTNVDDPWGQAPPSPGAPTEIGSTDQEVDTDTEAGIGEANTASSETADESAPLAAGVATQEPAPPRPPRVPKEPKKPGPISVALEKLPRPLRILLQVGGSVLGLGLAGLFAMAWFASTEDLAFGAGEASTAVSPGPVTITYAEDLECVPESNTIYSPSSFGRWQQSHRLVDGVWTEDARNFWDGEPAELASDSACGTDNEIEVQLPEDLPERVALCRRDNGCVEVTLG